MLQRTHSKKLMLGQEYMGIEKSGVLLPSLHHLSPLWTVEFNENVTSKLILLNRAFGTETITFLHIQQIASRRIVPDTFD